MGAQVGDEAAYGRLTGSPMNDPGPGIPTFLVLGAPKCGTTSVAWSLSQHPRVCFSEPKEPIFFEAEWERGLEHYRRKYFGGWRGEPAVGEGRTWNLYLPYVAPRIREAVPEARLVAVLRHPVDRAYSHWWHRYSRGIESLPFEEAVAEDRARISRGATFEGEEGERRWRAGLYRDSFTTRHRALLDLGFYADQLERYRALFPAERIRVILYDDLEADAEGTLRGLYAFLGVDPDVPGIDTSPQNVQRVRRRSPLARRLSFTARALGLRHLVPRRWRGTLRRGLLPERAARRPELLPETRRELAAWYAPHVARLEKLLGRDLASWRT